MIVGIKHWLHMHRFILSVLLASLFVTPSYAAGNGVGPDPALPAPQSSLVPTVNIAPAKGWPAGMTPKAAPGFKVNMFAKDFDHSRWIYVLPNNNVLVAETDAPPKPDEKPSIKGFVMKKVMNAAGSQKRPSADRITLLRDTDNDGVADLRSVFLENLRSPLGMVLVGNDFYVANADSLVRYPYKTGQTKITDKETRVMNLPGLPLNHHWTKNVVVSADNSKLYISVGSNSNVGENGLDKEVGRAAIHEYDLKTGKSRIYASGLRNPNGLAINPVNGVLWTAVNERDELGNDLVPDYMTSVKDGGFYGWPYSYFGQNVDTRVKEQRPDLVAKAIKPDYALGAHTASLGLTFYNKDLFPSMYRNGAFIGQHGSWNRKPHSGYKVIFVPFKNGMPAGDPQDILTGFLDKDGNALGRPVGVTPDQKGALLVADDVGNVVWRIVPDKR